MSGATLIKQMKDKNVPAYKIPSARFADAWLLRSVYKQIHRPVRKAKSISTFIAYYPNQLVSADTIFIKQKLAKEIDDIHMLPKAKQ